MSILLLRKTVDKSFLTAGLTVPKESVPHFMSALGVNLKRGEKTSINIIVDGISFQASFTHVDIKTADRDIFQIRYSEKSPLGRHLRSRLFTNPEKNRKQYVEVWSSEGHSLEFRCSDIGYDSTPSLLKNEFFEYLGPEDSLSGYVKSYKLVFYASFFITEKFERRVDTDAFTDRFHSFYIERYKAGLTSELDSTSILFNPEKCSRKAVYQLILNNPYKAISRRRYFSKERDGEKEYFALLPELYSQLSEQDLDSIKNIITKKIALYYSKAEPNKIKGKKSMTAEKEPKKLKQRELHERFLDDLGQVAFLVNDPAKKPLIINLGAPFFCKLKVYMFNCTCPPGGRKPDEFKSQLILDGQQRNERGYLDDTDGTFILLVGYAMPYGDKDAGVYVLWDAEKHRTFAYSANLQTKLDPILETAYSDVVLQTKKSGEIVVLSNRMHLTNAITERLRLYADRLLGE